MIECDYKQMGYGSSAYVESLSEFGEPIYLSGSGGYLLKRTIADTSCIDAMGGYPLFFCDDWSALSGDLERLPDDVVSVSLVADPFGSYNVGMLNECFDVVNPFKCHYIVDLQCPADEVGNRSHRKQARKALKNIRVEVCREPRGFTEEWRRLYRTLKMRYNITGVRAFSQHSFQQQLSMPDVVVLQAFYANELVGAQIYYQQNDVMHCHLGAVNDLGYRTGAFYAMDYYSFAYFSDRALKLDLGGGAGLTGGRDDGLSLYKAGWSSETRPVYFCGRIIDPQKYASLSVAAGCADASYFPAYRNGEFA